MPVLMALIIFTWFTYSATPFLQQFLAEHIEQFGEVQENVNSSLSSRIGGTPEHEFVVEMRLIMTVFLWTLALVGAVVRLRRGHRDWEFVLLAASPVLLLALQPYGGEIGLRIYLFSLPGIAFFVAALVAHWLQESVPRTIIGVSVLSALLLSAFMITRYGNEQVDYFSRAEFSAVQHLYRIAPPGSRFLVLQQNLPWRWQRYASYGHENISVSWGDGPPSELELAPTVREIVENMRNGDSEAFLVFTRGQREFAESLGLAPRGAVKRLEKAVSKSPRLKRIYANRDAAIYVLRTHRLATAARRTDAVTPT